MAFKADNALAAEAAMRDKGGPPPERGMSKYNNVKAYYLALQIMVGDPTTTKKDLMMWQLGNACRGCFPKHHFGMSILA